MPCPFVKEEQSSQETKMVQQRMGADSKELPGIGTRTTEQSEGCDEDGQPRASLLGLAQVEGSPGGSEPPLPPNIPPRG
jgi:hypothetical protein